LAALYTTYRERDLEIVGVNTFNDQEEAARDFVKRYELSFTIGRDVSGAIGRLYSVTHTPTVIFVDTVGLLVEQHVGGMSEVEFQKKIEDLLK
jgi:cytochrome c biogenesis protein CcmG, thiol:disulfide interchange protein DsbE